MKHSVYIPSRIEVYVRPDLGWMIRFACARYLYRCRMHNILFKQLFNTRWPCITGDLEVSSKPPKAREVYHTYAGSASSSISCKILISTRP